MAPVDSPSRINGRLTTQPLDLVFAGIDDNLSQPVALAQLDRLILAERRSVTEVGLVHGDSDTSSFTSVFHKITGFTPTAYCRSRSAALAGMGGSTMNIVGRSYDLVRGEVCHHQRACAGDGGMLCPPAASPLPMMLTAPVGSPGIPLGATGLALPDAEFCELLGGRNARAGDHVRWWRYDHDLPCLRATGSFCHANGCKTIHQRRFHK